MSAAEDEETPRGAAPSPGGAGDDDAGADEEEDGADGRCGTWRRGWARYEALATAVGKAMLDADEEEPPERGGEPRDGVVVRELEELHNQDMIYVVRAPRRRVLSFISRGVRETLTKRVDGDGAPRDRAYYAAAKRLLANETIREILINGVLTVGSCFFTYAIIRSTEATVSPTVAQLLVTVVFSSFYPEYAATFGIGAFGAASGANIVNYAWLTLQAFTVALVWIMMIYSELLKGMAGRLGCGAFVASNITTLLECATGAVPWTVYFDSASSGSYLNLTVLRGVTIVVACPVCVVLTKVVRTRLILNPVQGSAATGLVLVLIITCIGTERFLYAEQAISSLGVGTFAGMVSYSYIRSTLGLAIMGVLGGFVQLALFPPFSGGFGGWEGFCAAVACFIYLAGRWLLRRILRRCVALPRRPKDCP